MRGLRNESKEKERILGMDDHLATQQINGTK
jgi:hypothetical protein